MATDADGDMDGDAAPDADMNMMCPPVVPHPIVVAGYGIPPNPTHHKPKMPAYRKKYPGHSIKPKHSKRK